MLMIFAKKILPIIGISSMLMLAANVTEIKHAYQNHSTGYDLFNYSGYKYTSSSYKLDNALSDKLMEHHIDQLHGNCNEDYNCTADVGNLHTVKKNGAITRSFKKELKYIYKYIK